MNKPMEWYRMQVSEMQRRLAQKATDVSRQLSRLSLALESRVR